MRILLLISVCLLAKGSFGQDSTTAVYINDAIEKIETRVGTDIVESRDTTIFDDGDTLQRGAFLTVHTEFFTDPTTMLLDKIVEKSLYQKTSTELTIYFLGNQPIRFTNRQWQGSSLNVDFDIYYMNDNTVFTTKRSNLRGNPDGDAFLKWCYQLRGQYFKVVQEYNQTFVRTKSNHGRLK
jgi:hypothetical protein